MRKIAAGCVFVVLALGGCGGTTPDDQEAPAGTAPARTEPVSEAPRTEPAPATPADPGGGQWPMPDLVGSVLQDAQDHVQELTDGAVLYTASHDLSGEGRNQVVDANWKVCTQNVLPGAPLTADSRVDFGVVKIDETCP